MVIVRNNLLQSLSQAKKEDRNITYFLWSSDPVEFSVCAVYYEYQKSESPL